MSERRIHIDEYLGYASYIRSDYLKRLSRVGHRTKYEFAGSKRAALELVREETRLGLTVKSVQFNGICRFLLALCLFMRSE